MKASKPIASRTARVIPVVAVSIWIALLAALGDGRDFRTFLESVSAWRAEGTLYPGVDYPNLNLPHASLLFVPLAELPWTAAFAVWQAFQILCALRVLWLLPGLPPWAWILIAVAQPVVTATMIGQIAWPMAWLVSEAAHAARRGLTSRAAVWLTVAGLLKPFLGLVLAGCVWRRPRALVPASIASAAVLGAGLAAFGIGEYVAWWHAARATAGHPHAGNISLSGALWHLGAPGLAIVPQLAVLAVSAWSVWRGADLWRVLLPASLLLSPLTWVYYACLLAPLVRPDRTNAIAGVLLAVPKAALPLWVPLGTIGLLIFWADGLRHARSGAAAPTESAQRTF